MTNQDPRATDEARSEIRFALSQLSSRDAHHEFEHLTRTLARNTVTRRILPATGPVAGRGDQGRDYETYRTELPGNELPLGAALGIGPDDGVAFACTLQKEGTLRKLKSDLEAIAATGSEATWAIAYCEPNIRVADRHDFQAEILDEMDIHVEVFDGNSIAELLAQNHLYWIARQHLSLSHRSLPEPTERPDWYEILVDRWRNSEDEPASVADLVSVQTGARYASDNPDSHIHLPFWLDLLSSIYENEGLDSELRMGAAYDIVRSNLRGLADIRRFGALIHEIVNYAIDSDSPASLTDATTTVMYAEGARLRGRTDLTAPDIALLFDRLFDRLEALREATSSPHRQCALLDSIVRIVGRPNTGDQPDALFRSRNCHSTPTRRFKLPSRTA